MTGPKVHVRCCAWYLANIAAAHLGIVTPFSSCSAVPLFAHFEAGWQAVKEIVGKVWYGLITAIATAAFIHGHVASALLCGILRADAWWPVPAAVVPGISIYANVAGIIAVIEALPGKDAAPGWPRLFRLHIPSLNDTSRCHAGFSQTGGRKDDTPENPNWFKPSTTKQKD